ncbi:probable G-protein coupled receptor 139 [Haliotis asinina]|uniref:probable G-protein coupled receptor 139 n=1 Tax=Haliotis asinina TaxID=109174 RepID=UPI0035324998
MTTTPTETETAPINLIYSLDDQSDLNTDILGWSNFSRNKTFSQQVTQGPTFLQQMEQQMEYQLSVSLIQWVFPFLILLGTIGNGLSLTIMCQREMRQTSTCFYLAVLAIADTTVLYISAFKTWLRTVSGFELLHVSQASCKITMFLAYFSTHFSAWIIVAVTVERFLAVWFPLKAGTMCSVSRAKFGTIIIAGLVILINCQVLWTAELKSVPSSSLSETKLMCIPYKDYAEFVCELLAWMNLILYSFLPFVVLLLFNILIIINLLKHRQVLTSTMTKDDQQMRSSHRKLAITLLSVSFAWIVTTMPSTLFLVFKPRPVSVSHAAQQQLVRVICYSLMYVNHAINFGLYCITGNRFRHELNRLLCRKPTSSPRATLTFKNSASGQDSSGYPLMENVYMNAISSEQSNSN